ncbi:hypothetical protein MTR_1g106945 [Medicago truncatula]|uniref:Uncharacterized protein n=1 Tax=Medicago truncatula TaxID=3880 RepID=A0A072VRH9_MEDTR|nr:hypothetical protein MTR_1g106945 [Medicago truncatula]
MYNFGFASNFNHSSSVPNNFNPYFRSMMGYPSQTPSFNGYMPMVNENFQSVGEYPEFSSQINRGGMTRDNEVAPTPKMLSGETRQVKHIGVKLLSIVTSIAHSILRAM